LSLLFGGFNKSAILFLRARVRSGSCKLITFSDEFSLFKVLFMSCVIAKEGFAPDSISELLSELFCNFDEPLYK